MRMLISRAFAAAGAIIIGIVVLSTIVAYDVRTGDSGSGIRYDGFGRALTDTPLIVRVLVGWNSLWAGWLWFAADFALFWGLLVSAFGLLSAGASFAGDDRCAATSEGASD